jgi:hypothetical protein
MARPSTRTHRLRHRGGVIQATLGGASPELTNPVTADIGAAEPLSASLADPALDPGVEEVAGRLSSPWTGRPRHLRPA